MSAHALAGARSRSLSATAVPLALVLLALGQLVSNLMFDLWAVAPLSSGADASPLVPPGGWFAIWGPIIALSIAWALVAFRPSVRTDPLHRRVAAGLVVATAGFSVWLGFAAFGQSNPPTVVVLVVIAAGLAWSARVLVASRDELRTWPTWERILVWTTVGIYLGWTSMATFVNIATVAQAAGADPSGTTGLVWQLGVLALAAGAAVALVVLTRGALLYGLTAAYALTGVAISTGTQGYPVLAVVAAVAVVLVLASTAILAIRHRSAFG